MATEKPLKLTRVSIGSGTVSEGTDLADVHQLLSYVVDGEIAERSHEGERLNLTIQYANSLHKAQATFYLAEFMVFAEDPETGSEVDLLYATLGDYKQPVPAYVEGVPGSVFNLPLVLVVSNDLSVEITASPGLVTYAQLEESVKRATDEAMEGLQPGWSVCSTVRPTIPVSGWVKAEEPTSDYAYICDVTVSGVTEAMIPHGCPVPGYFGYAFDAGMMASCSVQNDSIRFYAQRIPEADILCEINLLRLGSSGGSGGSVDPGVGLGFTMDGKLNVQLGSGLSVDGSNHINVDRTEVVTDADMLNEDETAQSLKDILLSGDAESPTEAPKEGK